MKIQFLNVTCEFNNWTGKFISHKFLQEVKYLSRFNLIKDSVYL